MPSPVRKYCTTDRMSVSRRNGTNQMPTSSPKSGAKMMVVDSQLMRSRSGSCESSLSVMYLDVFVFSKYTPLAASNSVSPAVVAAGVVPVVPDGGAPEVHMLAAREARAIDGGCLDGRGGRQYRTTQAATTSRGRGEVTPCPPRPIYIRVRQSVVGSGFADCLRRGKKPLVSGMLEYSLQYNNLQFSIINFGYCPPLLRSGRQFRGCWGHIGEACFEMQRYRSHNFPKRLGPVLPRSH